MRQPTRVEQTTVTTDTNQVKEEDQAGMLSTPPTGMQHFNSFKTGTLFACPEYRNTEMKFENHIEIIK